MQHKLDSGSFDDITEVDDSWWVGPAARVTRLRQRLGSRGRRRTRHLGRRDLHHRAGRAHPRLRGRSR
jgi:hypothetical protein